MMSSQEFKKRSSIFFARRKNPIILDIDKLLGEYEKSVSENRKMKCLVYIYMMCKHYRTTKPHGKRGEAVQDLMDQVREIIDSPAFKKQVAEKAGGRHYSNGQQQNLASHVGNNDATSLSAGYTWEGILPQKNFVQKMGLSLESLIGPNNAYYGTSGISQRVEGDFEKKGFNPQQVEHKTKEFLTGNLSQVLDRLHEMWLKNEGDGTFRYLNSAGREEFLLKVQGGSLYRLQSNVLFDTGFFRGAQEERLYAMDTSERLYALGTSQNGVGVSWNHSSLLSGHMAVCAGMITVANGVLQQIDNNSGHYKPDTQNLVSCVRSLVRAGIPAITFRVVDKAKNQTYANAALFLAMNP